MDPGLGRRIEPFFKKSCHCYSNFKRFAGTKFDGLGTNPQKNEKFAR